MVGAADGHHAAAVLFCAIDGHRHGFLADYLAVALAAVEREQRSRVDLHLRVLVDQQTALEQRVDVARDHADAVRVMAEQVGHDQVLGNELRFGRVAPAGRDHSLDRSDQSFFLEDHAYSGLMPPRFTTSVQRSTSSFMNLPTSSGVLATTSKPICVRRSRTSGERSAFTDASFSRATISFGVFAGAAAACHEVTIRSG